MLAIFTSSSSVVFDCMPALRVCASSVIVSISSTFLFRHRPKAEMLWNRSSVTNVQHVWISDRTCVCCSELSIPIF